MKYAKVVITTFCICIALSLIIGTLLLLNAKAIAKNTRLVDTGKQILESVLELESKEKAYLLHQQVDMQKDVKDRIENLRRQLSHYEKYRSSSDQKLFREFDAWEEALNLYERLFDQFILYSETVEKNISDIRSLEKSILAVIYSKMNPERGIIALQEIRIHEKGYLLYRNYPKPPDERTFEDMRKEAVNNLLLWARDDKRIVKLMEQDNQLFEEILNNYAGQDHTLLALRRESGRMKDIGQKFFEEGNKTLHVIHRRCGFLSTTLLVIWAVVAIAIITTRFRS
jgi:hypothetical protein